MLRSMRGTDPTISTHLGGQARVNCSIRIDTHLNCPSLPQAQFHISMAKKQEQIVMTVMTVN